jgi:hypothetical protein
MSLLAARNWRICSMLSASARCMITFTDPQFA